MKKFNYENTNYLKKLDALPDTFYSKYVHFLERYSKKRKSKILDVGCGTGSVLSKLGKMGFLDLSGVDVSKTFITRAKASGIRKSYVYDGLNLPFKDNYFDVIGSFNVLEHTQEPEEFLEKQILKLKRNGYLIVACPNFYTPILKTNHRRIHGLKNRLTNLMRIFYTLLISSSFSFERIPPVVKKKFEYDDDSIVVTNPIVLKNILLKNKCKIIYESGFINQDSMVSHLIDRLTPLRYMMPSCFMVAQKK